MESFGESSRVNWAAIRTVAWGAIALGLYGARRRPLSGLFILLAATPIALSGERRWSTLSRGSGDTRIALKNNKGFPVREAVRLERPIAEIYRFWRRLENLPRFMTYLESVSETDGNKSHWIAKGPAGLRVEWDAEIINDVENKVIGWRSLPGSDVVTAGSVNFDSGRGGRSTEVSVHLRYSPPAGRAGVFVSTMFGRAPAQTIREDMRRLKQLLEAGEIAQAVSPSTAATR